MLANSRALALPSLIDLPDCPLGTWSPVVSRAWSRSARSEMLSAALAVPTWACRRSNQGNRFRYHHAKWKPIYEQTRRL